MTKVKARAGYKHITGAIMPRQLGETEVIFGSQTNTSNMDDLIPTKPWRRLHWSIDGIIENRTTNTTPRFRVDWVAGSGKSFKTDFIHGAWWCDSHTSYDYGSESHVRGNELIGVDTMSLGWLAGANRDLGQQAGFHLEIDLAEMNGRLTLCSHWYGMRQTLDYMVHVKGTYTWNASTSDISAMDVWFGGSTYSYNYKAEFHS